MRHTLIILLLFLSPAVKHALAAASPAQEAFDSVFAADVQRVKAARDPKAVVELAARMLATARESKSQMNSGDAIIFSWPLSLPRQSVNGKSVLCPHINRRPAKNAGGDKYCVPGTLGPVREVGGGAGVVRAQNSPSD
jgi:hypothetical protein